MCSRQDQTGIMTTFIRRHLNFPSMASIRAAKYHRSLAPSSVHLLNTHKQYHPAALDQGHLFQNPDMERRRSCSRGRDPGRAFGRPGKRYFSMNALGDKR